LRGMAEELLEHGDHVLEAVIVVVEKDDVVRRLPLRLLLFLLLRARQRDRVTHGRVLYLRSVLAAQPPPPGRPPLVYHAVVSHASVRPKQTSVMSSCWPRPAACSLTFLTIRSPSSAG